MCRKGTAPAQQPASQARLALSEGEETLERKLRAESRSVGGMAGKEASIARRSSRESEAQQKTAWAEWGGPQKLAGRALRSPSSSRERLVTVSSSSEAGVPIQGEPGGSGRRSVRFSGPGGKEPLKGEGG